MQDICGCGRQLVSDGENRAMFWNLDKDLWLSCILLVGSFYLSVVYMAESDVFTRREMKQMFLSAYMYFTLG